VNDDENGPRMSLEEAIEQAHISRLKRRKTRRDEMAWEVLTIHDRQIEWFGPGFGPDDPHV